MRVSILRLASRRLRFTDYGGSTCRNRANYYLTVLLPVVTAEETALMASRLPFSGK